jgi:hypothetical protein
MCDERLPPPTRLRRAPAHQRRHAIDDLDSTLEQIAAQGIEPERPPYQVVEGGSRIYFVRDQDRKLTIAN